MMTMQDLFWNNQPTVLRRLRRVEKIIGLVLLGIIMLPTKSWACWYGDVHVWHPCAGPPYMVEDIEGDIYKEIMSEVTFSIGLDKDDLTLDATQLDYTNMPDVENIFQAGYYQASNAIQLNAEETKSVLEGVSQAVIDSNKAAAQTKAAAKRQARATMPQLATGCTLAAAVQKRNASGSATDSAASGYVLVAQREGTGAYGAVPDNSSSTASANRLCGRKGDNWTYARNDGPGGTQLQCP